MNAKELCAVADNLFSKKLSLNSLWQEVAENFYPERADFTITRAMGTDFAANLMTSYPVLCRRDLGNQFSTMLRPTAKPWFHQTIRFEEKVDNDTRKYLEYFEETQRKAMYDPVAKFTRATKEGDHDFAAFGQCAISVEVNHNSRVGSHLLYRCWHLRDMCWQEDETGSIGARFRKWKPTVQVICNTFKDVHPNVRQMNEKDPFAEFEIRHMVVPVEMYDKTTNLPWMSVWYDPTNNFVMEETPLWTPFYVIPRWQTVSSQLYGSQYAFSPAVVAGLPDARLIQAMSFTLLEAGEKATSPPVIATQDAVRSDVALYAGGITWVDNEYDERLGEALRPLTQDFRGFNYGVEMSRDCRLLINKAFFLDVLTMPQRGPEMTAYEVGQRVQEYIRNALPIFEPMEMEYNAELCDQTFELLWRNGAFGDPRTWPKTLRGASIDFQFESPLHDAIDQQKGQKLLEVKGMLAEAIALDPSSRFIIDVKSALRDALEGIQTPATWMHSEADVDAMEKQEQQTQAAQQMLASMEQASNVTNNLATAQKSQAEAAPAAA